MTPIRFAIRLIMLVDFILWILSPASGIYDAKRAMYRRCVLAIQISYRNRIEGRVSEQRGYCDRIY